MDAYGLNLVDFVAYPLEVSEYILWSNYSQINCQM